MYILYLHFSPLYPSVHYFLAFTTSTRFFQSKASEPGDAGSTAPPRPSPPTDAALSLGMAFVEAAGAQQPPKGAGAEAGATASRDGGVRGPPPPAAAAVAALQLQLSQADQLR